MARRSAEAVWRTSAELLTPHPVRAMHNHSELQWSVQSVNRVHAVFFNENAPF